MNFSNKTTPVRNQDKKYSNLQQPEKVQTPGIQNSSMMSSKRPSEIQVQKIQAQPQEQDKQLLQQLIAQEFKDKIQDELMKINKLEEQYKELQNENLQIKQKIEQQDVKIQKQEEKIQQQEYKIQQQEEKIQQQELKIESQMQNQGKIEIQEKIQNFISNNDKAHEIWRISAEKISNAYGIIQKQFQDLDIYKQQIAEKVNEYNMNITQLVQEELKVFEQQIQQTQQQTDQNLNNLSGYEEILKKYCEEINKCLNIQGIQVPNYNNSQFQQYDQQQQYPLQQLDQQYPQQYQQQQLDQQQFQQPIHSQINFIAPQFQQPQSNFNQTTQNDTNPQIQFMPNYQEQPGPQQGKSKIRLLSSTQGPTPQ